MFWQSQDEDDIKLQTVTYGGGGFTLLTTEELSPENYLKCKLFFNEEAAAIYCYAKIVKVETTEDGKLYTLVFCRIRDDDKRDCS